jgi:hypothetical protein
MKNQLRDLRSCDSVPFPAILVDGDQEVSSSTIPCHCRFLAPARNNGRPREKEQRDFTHQRAIAVTRTSVETRPLGVRTANLHSPLHAGVSVKLLARQEHLDRTSQEPFLCPHAAQRFTLHTSISCPSRQGSVLRADNIRHEQWGARWG